MIRVDVSTGTWRNPSPAGKSLRLIAAGDICPAQGWKLDELFSAGRASVESVYGDLLPELARKDLSVADLELPLSAGGERIVKDGPHLRGPTAAIEGFLARLNRLSELIADADLHERFWNAYCLARLPFYLGRLQETRSGLDRPELRQLAAAHLRNLFTCEAHHEVIATGLELIRQGLENHCFGVEEELEKMKNG